MFRILYYFKQIFFSYFLKLFQVCPDFLVDEVRKFAYSLIKCFKVSFAFRLPHN